MLSNVHTIGCYLIITDHENLRKYIDLSHTEEHGSHTLEIFHFQKSSARREVGGCARSLPWYMHACLPARTYAIIARVHALQPICTREISSKTAIITPQCGSLKVNDKTS